MKNRSTSAAFGVVAILCGLVWSQPVEAEEAKPEVFVDTELATCSTDFIERFEKELKLRSSAEVVSSASTNNDRNWRLTLNLIDDGACEVRLEKADKFTSFVVAEDIEQLDLVSIVTRLAWIIDGLAEPPPTPSEQEEEEAAAEAEKGELTAINARSQSAEAAVSLALSTGEVVEEQIRLLAMKIQTSRTQSPPTPEALNGLTKAATTPDRTNFSVGAVGGTMWLPSTTSTLMMIQGQMNWQPWTNIKFGLAGRLPMGATSWDAQGMRYSYKTWSVDLTASYVQRFLNSWDFVAGGGVRRTISELTAVELSQGQSEDGGQNRPEQANPVVDDTPRVIPTNESDNATYNALSPWAAVATMGGNYAFTRNLAIGLEVTVATSLVNRTVRKDDRVIMDLGRFDLDLLLGLELRF